MRVQRQHLNCLLLAGLWILMMVLRQDFWFARDPRLVFGVLPAALAYQAVYSLVVAVVMACLVRFAWPTHLEPPSESKDP